MSEPSVKLLSFEAEELFEGTNKEKCESSRRLLIMRIRADLGHAFLEVLESSYRTEHRESSEVS